MKKIIAFLLLVFGIALLGSAVYLYLKPTTFRSIGDLLAIVGVLLGGILAAGTGIKDWLELLKSNKASKPEEKFEISGDSPQISTGEKSRNIQTGGGDYIENLEISLSIQDKTFRDQITTRKSVEKR